MNAKQEVAIRQALHDFTQSKRKTRRLYKKEVKRSDNAVGAETRYFVSMAEAGEELSSAIRRALRKA